MSRIVIDNEKLHFCPNCGENYCRNNDSLMLLKRISFVFIDKNTGEILVKCSKCKEEIKIS